MLFDGPGWSSPGHVHALRGGATDVSPREGGVGWEKGTHEQRWPGNTDSLKSYFDFEASEWVAAEGPVPSLSVWLGKVPTSHELYLFAE